MNQTENEQSRKVEVSRSFINRLLFPKYSKWQLLEVYFFNTSWYAVQVRQNIETGYKYFKCRKIVDPNYGKSGRINVENIEAVVFKNFG